MNFQERIDNKMKRYTHLTNIPEGQHTIGAFISAVMEIDNPEDAKEFYEGALEHQAGYGRDDVTPQEVIKSNIGWCYGEGMADERKQMWIAVCGATHPVFGNMTPTSEEAFQAGVKAGEATE